MLKKLNEFIHNLDSKDIKLFICYVFSVAVLCSVLIVSCISTLTAKDGGSIHTTTSNNVNVEKDTTKTTETTDTSDTDVNINPNIDFSKNKNRGK